MFFYELPVGARFLFNGVSLTKTSMGGNCVHDSGAHDWMASHNTVESLPTAATQTTTDGIAEFTKLFPESFRMPVDGPEPFPLPPQQLSP